MRLTPRAPIDPNPRPRLVVRVKLPGESRGRPALLVAAGPEWVTVLLQLNAASRRTRGRWARLPTTFYRDRVTGA